MDIITGAILVQHTTWTNAERAVDALHAGGALDPASILALPDGRLIEMIRGSGTPTVKAKRLRALATTIMDTGGLDTFLALPLSEMRPLLLSTHGVGPETADAIALYAAVIGRSSSMPTRVGCSAASASGRNAKATMTGARSSRRRFRMRTRRCSSATTPGSRSMARRCAGRSRAAVGVRWSISARLE